MEVKSAVAFDNYMTAQILNYLKCAGGGIGLLVNFGRSVQFKRFVVGDPSNSLPCLRAQVSAAGGLRRPLTLACLPPCPFRVHPCKIRVNPR